MSESQSSITTLSVSSLVRVFQCPRRYYFSQNESISASDRYIICKQVSLACTGVIDEEKLWDEISLIKPDISRELKDFLSICIEKVTSMPAMSYTDADLLVTSRKYGLSGTIDKYDARSSRIAITRNSSAPCAGCWPQDRLRIAAYMLCFKETTGVTLNGGYVEYIPDGIIRFCEPQPRDRRALLLTLKKAHKIHTGELPEKPVKVSCKTCRFIDQCNPPKVRRLSDLLMKK
jgi:CRISPR-associated exonuclease Cas4